MPTSLAPQRERLLAEVTRFSHAGLSGPEVLRRTADTLQRVVPFDAFCASTNDPASNLIVEGLAGGMDTTSAAAAEVGHAYMERVYFEEELAQIALMRRTGRPVARLQEVAEGPAERSLRRQVVLQPMGLAIQSGIIFDDRGLWGSMEIMRAPDNPDFATAELELVRQIVPRVTAGLRVSALRARAETADGGNTPGVLVIDAAGRVVSITLSAKQMLAEIEPGIANWEEQRGLPVPVTMVLGALDRTMRPESARDAHVIPRLRFRTRAGRWLSLHADLAEPGPDQTGVRIIVIAPVEPHEVAWLSLASYALTPREEETVKLVVGGLSTKQIADRLFIAEHTVQRHLTNIFEKTGVRSRRALVKHLYFAHVADGAG